MPALKTRRARIALTVTMGVILSLGGAYAWLLLDRRDPNTATFSLDLAQIRAMALAEPDQLPVRVEVETVSHMAVPGIVMVAGASWDRIDLVRNAYRVVGPAGDVIIDTGYDAATARAAKVDVFDEAAQARVWAAMPKALAIIVTHEHADHMGGLMTAPDQDAAWAKARLTPEQLAQGAATKPLLWSKAARAVIRPLVYNRLHVVAPGVVLIKAPGHTPGSQMIFVRLASGQELVFMGDTASFLDNVRTGAIRSRLVTDFITKDDRPAVFAQIRALQTLAADEPGIALVPGHDAKVTQDLIARGLLTQGFSGP